MGKPTKDELYKLRYKMGVKQKEIAKLFHVGPGTISRWFVGYGIDKGSMPYTNVDWLSQKYGEMGLSPKEIARLAGCCTATINNWINKLGILRRPLRKNNAGILLEETLRSAYWVGFLMADGHFESRGRVTLNLQQKDWPHLRKLAEYIDYEGGVYENPEGSAYSIQFMHSNIKQLMEKHDIKPNKTYNPPQDIGYIDSDLRFAYSIGFVDGDGCVKNYANRKNFRLIVKCHKAWREMLNLMGAELFPEYIVAINKAGYAVLRTGNTGNLKNVKRKALKLGLPLLKRKWDVIDLNYIGQYELGEKRKEIAGKMLKAGHEKKDIADKLGVSVPAIYQMVYRHPEILAEEVI